MCDLERYSRMRWYTLSDGMGVYCRLFLGRKLGTHKGNVRIRKWGNVRLQLVSDAVRNVVRFRDRQIRSNLQDEIDRQLMSFPPRLHGGHGSHALHMARRVTRLTDNVWVNSVEHARDDRTSRLPDDAEDRDGDQQTDDGI